MAQMSKRVKNFKSLVNVDSTYTLDSALDILLSKYRDGKLCAKFDESVELAICLGVDPKQADQGVRGSVAMPNGLGKVVRIAVLVKTERVKEAKAAGADISGSEDLLEDIKNGKLDFDILITTPDMMPQLSKLGKILGPKGLMPNPRSGTVDEEVARAVARARAGQVDYRVDKAGIVHAAIGKLSFAKEALLENIKTLCNSVAGAKPAGLKGTYVKGFYVSTSMGPSIALDLKEIVS